jgi:hypothetical protein
MSERTWPDPQEDPDQTGGVSEDAPAGGMGGQGGEGGGAAQATPPIGEEGNVGETAVPASDEDPGVPSDEELAREEDQAG